MTFWDQMLRVVDESIKDVEHQLDHIGQLKEKETDLLIRKVDLLLVKKRISERMESDLQNGERGPGV